MHFAARHNHSLCITLLNQAGADQLSEDVASFIPLGVAVSWNPAVAVRVLLGSAAFTEGCMTFAAALSIALRAGSAQSAAVMLESDYWRQMLQYQRDF